MSYFSRYRNQGIAKLTTRFSYLAKRFTDGFSPLETEGIPWTPVRKPLAECKVAVVTTAGVHYKGYPPFDMNDPEGDPSFRVIDVSRPISDLKITHDYYDHSDADKDINIVFPIQRLWELERDGFIGHVAKTHYGFMGHTVGGHIQTLVKQSAPEVAQRLNTDAVDVVLLTPG
jgi:D-proline reductase (dithiol) PrdB